MNTSGNPASISGLANIGDTSGFVRFDEYVYNSAAACSAAGERILSVLRLLGVFIASESADMSNQGENSTSSSIFPRNFSLIDSTSATAMEAPEPSPAMMMWSVSAYSFFITGFKSSKGAGNGYCGAR